MSGPASKSAAWMHELSPDMPVGLAARHVLSARLAVVPALLEAAAGPAGARPGRQAGQTAADALERQVQDVRRLRVATRRAAAALRAFARCCPQTKARQVRQMLRRLRREAGAVRDCDVQLAAIDRLERECAAEPVASGDGPHPLAPALRRLRAALRRDRRKAYARLARLRGRREALRRASDELLAGVAALAGGAKADGWRRPARARTLRRTAHRQLARTVAAFRAAAACDLRRFDDLHELRIAGKRLRYTMEIFVGCYDRAFRSELYRRLKDIQDRLGAINDADQLRRLVERRLNRRAASADPRRVELRESLARLHAHLHEQAGSAQRAFLEWWSRPNATAFLDRLEALAAEDAARERPARAAAGQGGKAAQSGQGGNGAWSAPGGNGAWSAQGGDGAWSPPGAVHGGLPRVRAAAIDVGTNSIRLVIAEPDPRNQLRVIEDVKQTTRLGEGLYVTGRLKLDAVRRSVRALQHMKTVAGRYRAAPIRAVATSAVREASNGPAFVELVRRRAGLELETIDAEQEARLAHASVAGAFDLENQRIAAVDIGGGSTEIVFSTHGLVDAIAKLPLGAVHLTEAYGLPDGHYRLEPLLREIDARIRDALPPGANDPRQSRESRGSRQCRGVQASGLRAAPDLIIGTGGTFTALAKISLRRGLIGGADGRLPFNLRGYQLTYSEVRLLLDWLSEMSLIQRQTVPGISARRAEIVVAGVAIVERLMRRLGVQRVRVHDGGIRDGLLAEVLDDLGYRPGGPLDGAAGAVQHVRAFARQCGYEREHAEHVARLALQIFDQLVAQAPAGRPQWGRSEDRDLLHAAALLHDVGRAVSARRRHRHAHDLIVRSDITAFTRREVRIIANVARYHRRRRPSRRHASFARLSTDDQRRVERLAAILRVAVRLGRAQAQAVRAVQVTIGPRRARFDLRAERQPPIGGRRARRAAKLFERCFGRRVDFRWRPAAGPPGRRACPSPQSRPTPDQESTTR